MITFQSVSYTYPDGLKALDACSMTIRQNEITSLIGSSGCGKTTVLKLAAGLLEPGTGRIIRQKDGPALKAGMAFQDPVLLPWLSLWQNIMLPFKVSGPLRKYHRQNRRAVEDFAKELLSVSGLLEVSHLRPHKLSGGMKQRASLIRSLVYRPDILFLDEPFAALDAQTREKMWLFLFRLWKLQPLTVFLITHDLREAVFLSHQIMVMKKRPGRVVFEKENPFGKDRSIDITFSREFSAVTRTLYDELGKVMPAD